MHDNEVVKKILEKEPATAVIIDVYAMEIIMTSKEFAESIGYTQDEMIGMSLRKILAMEIEGISRLLSHLISQPKNAQEIIKGKDGKKYNASGDTHTFMDSGSPYLYVTNLKAVPHKE